MRGRLLDITFDLASFVFRLPRQCSVRLPLSRSTTATVTAGYHRCTILMPALPALMPTLLLLCRVVAKKKLRQPTRPCQCIGAGAAESQSASQPAIPTRGTLSRSQCCRTRRVLTFHFTHPCNEVHSRLDGWTGWMDNRMAERMAGKTGWHTAFPQ